MANLSPHLELTHAGTVAFINRWKAPCCSSSTTGDGPTSDCACVDLQCAWGKVAPLLRARLLGRDPDTIRSCTRFFNIFSNIRRTACRQGAAAFNAASAAIQRRVPAGTAAASACLKIALTGSPQHSSVGTEMPNPPGEDSAVVPRCHAGRCGSACRTPPRAPCPAHWTRSPEPDQGMGCRHRKAPWNAEGHRRGGAQTSDRASVRDRAPKPGVLRLEHLQTLHLLAVQPPYSCRHR